MEILKVIACLLDYPNKEVADQQQQIAKAISRSRLISPAHRAGLLTTLADIYGGELMSAEVEYTSLFEQGRSLSLHIFEHVHGESRDRGQAMVDLMQQYSNNGLEIDCSELPDYVPLFLEYLAQRPDLEAREWLADVSHVLALLGARLTKRDSSYANLFESLLLIAGRSEELKAQLSNVVGEQPDNTFEALDKEWEEVAVTFSTDDQACNSNTSQPAPGSNQPRPLIWADAQDSPIHTAAHTTAQRAQRPSL